mgnify:CR=1 FL=1
MKKLKAIQQLKQLKILVVGDSCEDIYHYGSCDRLSPEAPVPVFKEKSIKIVPGMSSNVVSNIKQFGCETLHITNTEQITKRRFVDSRFKQHLLRVDQGEYQTLANIDTTLLPLDVSAIFISDYDKGFLRPQDCEKICSLYSNLDIPIFVDSKKKNLSCFKNCFIKINKKEKTNCTSLPIDSKIIVTVGKHGAVYEGKNYPTTPVEVFDVSGAGDIFLSIFGLHYTLNKNVEQAINIANKYSAHSVTKFGTYIITPEDINELRF